MVQQGLFDVEVAPVALKLGSHPMLFAVALILVTNGDLFPIGQTVRIVRDVVGCDEISGDAECHKIEAGREGRLDNQDADVSALDPCLWVPASAVVPVKD